MYANDLHQLENTKKNNKCKESQSINNKRPTNEGRNVIDFEKKCLICMERNVDAIVSPCLHGGICFECAKITLDVRNSCYYCRDVVPTNLECLQSLPS